MLDSRGKLVGHLSGACATNLDDECDDVRQATIDGALNAYYPTVKAFLDPGTPGCADAGADGYPDAACGGTDCNHGDGLVHPNTAEACADRCDNDCDGLIDGADSGCGACDLLGNGDACTSDSECCSHRCRGKSGQMVFKG